MFSIEYRMNLPASPAFQPVFPRAGMLCYRPLNNTVRRAMMGNPDSDIILNNTLGGTVGRNGIFYDTNYISWSGGFVSLIDIWTGAKTEATSVYGDGAVALFTRSSGLLQIATLGGVGFVGWQSWTPFPPLAVTEETMGLNSVHLLMSVEQVTNAFNPLYAWRLNPYRVLTYTIAPNYFTTIYNRTAIFEADNLLYSWQDTTLPWFFKQDATYLYECWYKATAGTPGMARYNKATGVVNNINLSATAFTATPNRMNAWTIHQPSGRIYWAFDDNRFRLFGADLSAWPISNATADFIDVDTNSGNGSIVGIAVYPPYIYLAKNTGLTYGNQFIKIYDGKLMTKAKYYLGTKPSIRFKF